MQWSSLKSKVEALFAPPLKGRVELRATRYRGAHDQTGRGYITVDGKEVWNMCTLSFWGAEYPRIDSIAQEQQISARAAQVIADTQLEQEGVLAQWSFYRALESYCNSSIESSLESKSPLTKALAVLDARLGKRRLKKLDVSAEHPMVQFFFKLRCEAEGISLTTRSRPTSQASPEPRP
jgi:hypothetical protein